jgi:citrate lyase gamma subunit
MLDEVANAEGLPLYAITDFMVHFRLTDEGMVELEEFGEQFGDHVMERVHPVLGELEVSPYDAEPEDRVRIKAAVQLERNWLKATSAPSPDTELGKQIKAQMDMPTSIVNRQIHRRARKVLREAKPKGKPN